MPTTTNIWKKRQNRAHQARPLGSEIRALTTTAHHQLTGQRAGLCPTRLIKGELLELPRRTSGTI